MCVCAEVGEGRTVGGAASDQGCAPGVLHYAGVGEGRTVGGLCQTRAVPGGVLEGSVSFQASEMGTSEFLILL